MIVKVRTTPTEVFLVTGQDLVDALNITENDSDQKHGFVTSSFGQDGLFWETPEAFEQEYSEAFPEFSTKRD